MITAQEPNDIRFGSDSGARAGAGGGAEPMRGTGVDRRHGMGWAATARAAEVRLAGDGAAIAAADAASDRSGGPPPAGRRGWI